MLSHRESEKAQRYLSLLDTARCDGKWQEVPELARKVGKHAPQRKCLVLTARSESEVVTQSSRHPGTTKSNHPNNLSRLVPELRTAIENRVALPEDVFQAQTCLGWLYWIMGQPEMAVSTLPTAMPLITNSVTEKQGILSRWTHVCMIKSAYILGASQESIGSPADVVNTYKSALSLLSNTSRASGNSPEYRLWAEKLLVRSCILSSQYYIPNGRNEGHIGRPEVSLMPFRAWANFWERSSGDSQAPGSTIERGALQERRSIWRAYYNLLSLLLQHGYSYPILASSKEVEPSRIQGDGDEVQAQTRRQQIEELQRVETTYEGLLLKEVSFPRANENNSEVLSWVDQVMLNWSVLTSPTWYDNDLTSGGQEGVGRNVLEILYRAAARTFHATSILRHLFTVHSSLAEFDLAGKALDSYLDIVAKGHSRIEKSGEVELELDSNDIMLQTVAEGIDMFAKFGRREEAIKVWDFTARLEKWLYDHDFQRSLETQSAKRAIPESQSDPTLNKSSLSRITLIIVYRAIGIGRAHWARFTYDAPKRSEFQNKAIESFRRALEISTDQGDSETLYALALTLAETRDIDAAIATVKLALSSDVISPAKLNSQIASRADPVLDHLDARRKINQWHLLALLLSARQDFDTAEASCEAGLDNSYISLQAIKASPGRRAVNIQLNEKLQILELKMTQIALAEVTEGPEVAVNAAGELIGLYKSFFDPVKAKFNSQDLKPIPLPPPTANGTVKSFRTSVFGRSRDSRQGFRPNTGAESVRSQRQSNETSRPPTISITNNQDVMSDQLSPPDSSQSHHVFRHTSKRLQKRNSKRSIRSRTQSPSGTLNSTRGPTKSSLNPQRLNGTSSASLSSLQRPGTPGAEASSTVGVAVSHDLPTIPASPMAEQDDPTNNFQQLSIDRVSDNGQTRSRDNEHDAQASIGFSSTPLSNVVLSPQPRFLQSEQGRQAISLLLKIWLFIAGLYRRAKMYDDAQEAVDEAFKHVKAVEASVASQNSSARAFQTRAWGGAKSVEELWADAYAERGYLSVARSTPHDAMIQYESALSHCPDHVGATIGLSNILHDIYAQTISAHLERKLLQPISERSPTRIKESSRPILATVSPLPSSSKGLQSYDDPDTLDPLDQNSSTQSPLSASQDQSPEALDRLSARDRAYGLLSSLTKLGTAWDSSEAWFALARAYEESGQLERAKEVLWWVVELEGKRPIRDWSCLGQGYSL